MMRSIEVQNPQPIGERFMFVDYGEEGEPWHERYVYDILPGREAVIITPDYDVYTEMLEVGAGKFRNLRICAAGSRALPAGLGKTYGQPTSFCWCRHSAGSLRASTQVVC